MITVKIRTAAQVRTLQLLICLGSWQDHSDWARHLGRSRKEAIKDTDINTSHFWSDINLCFVCMLKVTNPTMFCTVSLRRDGTLSAAEHYVHLPFCSWSNHSPEQTSRRAFRFSAPSVWNSLSQTVLRSETLCLFLNLDLNVFIHSGFHWTPIRPATSACEVTTIWHYINFIIVSLLLLSNKQ